MNIIFFGSSEFGIPALKRLLMAHTVRAIVSTPPRPQGRGLKFVGSAISVFAQKQGFGPIITPDNLNDRNFFDEISHCKADIFIVIAYRILPKVLFSLPLLGTINIHASLLPKYRGPAPIQRAIEAGEKETGITVFRIDEGVDTGDILLQKRIRIGSDDTAIDLFSKLSDCGADALIEVLDKLGQGTLHPFQQDNKLASPAPKLTKEEALINWRQSALAIYNKIRAFKPFPGTYALLDGKRLGIERAAPLEIDSPGETGTIVNAEGSFFDVRCLQGTLRVLEVKPEGRRSMSVHDFLLGNKVPEGTQLT
ncbi:MAG: methionyl-tRNA formyltransferase [Chitinispirillaceae bacterium]|jgi:methionyl-tRNA formyltransferase